MSYVFNPFTGNFDIAGSSVQIEAHVLTPAEVAQKQFVLPAQPKVPEKTLVQLETGIAQYPNVDFLVDGNVIRWSGLAMELLVEAGQRLHVTYQ